ncbi:polymorphic toxin-type HINT domain-containing protein [Streptomyces antimicrobicus]|uniref:Rhs family-like protein n=1 Tax=Streptomyces antimicrobicus TaxID=2883108 RepID=A0ABS8B457_9ACTN|nr:polymorphic toxin-type HINT domain-containing protein [Streptomyces antimicrobicus]MCB5179390.1 Rhs family-like protein [Streptomyces antimicrobicus]
MKRSWKGAPPVEWPKAATAKVSIPAESNAPLARNASPTGMFAVQAPPVAAGSLPVRLSSEAVSARKPGTADAPQPSVSAKVEVKGKETAAALGIDGVVLAVQPDSKAAATAPLSVQLDYTKFRNAFGGDWGSRLNLVALPACALSTPDKAQCRTRTPLASKNDAAAGTVTATLAAPSGATARTATAAAPMVLAATAGAAGSNGSFTATPLSATGSWQGGGSSGDFSWSYPIEIPSALGGPAPSLALGYSSASVDGRTSASSGQSSWAGEGWDLSGGSNFIERTFVPCANDKKVGSGFNNPKQATGDLCQGAPMVTWSLNGASSQLVLDDADPNKKTWRPAQDDGSRIELLDGATNGDTGGQHWRVTTVQGIQYYFGLNRLPGWASGKPETNSTWTVPVYGNHPGEECYQSSYASSVCDQAWRWNLDYVVDPRGNAMTYWYAKERNFYGSNVQDDGKSTPRGYDRSGWLQRIDYGLRSDNLFTAAPAKVDFTVTERCIPDANFDCAPGKLADGAQWEVAQHWPDVPADLICDAGKDCKDRFTPAFFSRKMLKDITTSVLKGSAHEPVDTWTLTQDFRSTGDGGVALEYPMWLAQIQRTGKNGGTPVSMPPVVFDGVQLPNRVDNNEDGSPPFLRWRVERIRTETGAAIAVKYAPTECSTTEPKNLPSSPESNTLRCYPVIKEVPDPTDPNGEKKLYFTDWFHKHRVDQVREENPNGISPTKETNYQYLGTPAWAYDNETEQLAEKARTWSQWRGYDRVRTLVGSAPDKRSQVDTLYFRGMDGDKDPSQPTGKRSVKVKDSEGGEIEDREQFAGQIRETLYYLGEGQALESASVSTPQARGPTATRKRADGAAPLEAWTVAVAKVSSRTVLSDGRGQRRTAVEHTFDDRGRISQTTDRGDLATLADDSCTRYEYKDDPAKWMFALQSRIEKLTVPCDGGALRPTHVASDIKVEYDEVGNVVKGESLASYEGTTPKYVLTGTSTHDVYGRTTSTTDVYGKTTRAEYTPASGAVVTKITTTNPLGHTRTDEIDPGRGLPLAQEDANKRRTVMRYDALGRLIKAWSPDRDPATTTPDAEFTYDIRPGSPDAPVVITNKYLLESGNYRTRYDLYDGSLRLRQTQQQALDKGRVITDTFYDSRGQVWMQNGAYFNDQAPSNQMWLPVESKIPSSTVTEYDGMGRPAATIARKNGQETWRTTTSYGGDWVAVDPPKGDTPTKALLDAQGRKTELLQFAGEGPTGPVAHSTKYAYTPKGQLDSVTDQSGSVWSYKYDMRGRPTEVNDPDKGTTRTTYDIGDRIQTVTDARGKTVAFAYDALGRSTATHEGSLQGRKLTEQTYDTLPGALGLPVASTRYDEQGNAYTQAVTGYDAEYRPLGSKVTIPANEGKLAGTYAYSSTYSKTVGLQTSVLHPAAAGLPADRVSIGYNGLDQAQQSAVNGRAFLTNSEFTPLGDLLRTYVGDAGKQIVSSFEFDEQTRRPTRSYVTQQTGTTGYSQISDASFQYDPAGNLLKVTDKQNGSVGATDTQCYAYDYLRRMTDAWSATDDCALKPGAAGPGSAPKVGGPDAYWHSYTFDAVGNRTSETKHDPAGDLTKNVTRTHAYATGGPAKKQLLKVDTKGPEGTRTESYAYDASGNTVQRTVFGDTQTLDWDVEGRLKKVTGKAGTPEAKDTEFLYDAQGNRLIRRDPTGTTLYLPGTEIHVAKATGAVKGTRYYAGPNGAAMTRIAEGGKVTTSYQISDTNGTATTSVDAATQQVTRRKFTPFGEVRGQKPSLWPGEKGFAGGTVDDSTGLIHLGAREYDPAIGRFISVDPLMNPAESQTMNPYAYALNNPVTFQDYSGLAGMIIITGPDDPRYEQARNVERNASHLFGGGGAPAPSKPKTTVSAQDVERAKKLKAQSKADIALSIAKEVFKGITGYDDIADCIGGNLKTCGWLLAEQALGILGKGKRFAEALYRAGKMFKRWADDVVWATKTLGRADDEAKAMAKYNDDLAAWQRQADADASAARKADEVEAPASRSTDSGGSGGDLDAPATSCKTRNSFTSDTPVLMADGSTKAVQDVKTGDKVLATDPESGETAVKEVAATIVGQGEKNLVEVTIDLDGPDGEATAKITATDGHPFWVPELHKWVKATDLATGDWLQTGAGTRVQVTAVKRWTQQATVYNLTVTGIHTYYVLAGATPVLVHNCGPGVATEDDAMLALGRAEELQASRNDYFMADVKGTTAVIGVFNSKTKAFTTRIGINGGGAMPSGWTLRPGEEFVQAAGHAEEGILNSLGPNEHAVFGAASRNFCVSICLPMLNTRGITVGGAGIRGHAAQNSPFTIFWATGG